MRYKKTNDVKTIFNKIYSMKKLTTIIFATIAMLVGYAQVVVAE